MKKIMAGIVAVLIIILLAAVALSPGERVPKGAAVFEVKQYIFVAKGEPIIVEMLVPLDTIPHGVVLGATDLKEGKKVRPDTLLASK